MTRSSLESADSNVLNVSFRKFTDTFSSRPKESQSAELCLKISKTFFANGPKDRIIQHCKLIYYGNISLTGMTTNTC